MERKLQSEIATYLRRKGAFVLTIQPQAGIPSGTPDIIALLDGGGWVALEVKKENPYKRDGTAKKGAFQPLQQETVRKLNNMYFARIIWPDVWPEVKEELDHLL